MFSYDVRDLKKVRKRLNQELTLIPFFRALDIKPEQERYFLDDGVDDLKLLKSSTVRARRGRWGYYKNRKRRKVSDDLPYGVWTGNTLQHTYKKKGIVKIRSRVMTISHKLKRKITNYWDLKRLDKYVEGVLDLWMQRALDGKRNLKVARARAL